MAEGSKRGARLRTTMYLQCGDGGNAQSQESAPGRALCKCSLGPGCKMYGCQNVVGGGGGCDRRRERTFSCCVLRNMDRGWEAAAGTMMVVIEGEEREGEAKKHARPALFLTPKIINFFFVFHEVLSEERRAGGDGQLLAEAHCNAHRILKQTLERAAHSTPGRPKNSAATWSSTTRRSADSDTVITVSFSSTPGAAFGLGMPPHARMHACGGLITAVNSLMPNIPKFDIVNEPPVYSSGIKLPFLARVARSPTFLFTA